MDSIPIALKHSAEPVSDGEDGAVCELLPDQLGDVVVRLSVQGGGGLVQDEEPALPEEGPAQADQLSLALAQVTPAFAQLRVQAAINT